MTVLNQFVRSQHAGDDSGAGDPTARPAPFFDPENDASDRLPNGDGPLRSDPFIHEVTDAS